MYSYNCVISGVHPSYAQCVTRGRVLYIIGHNVNELLSENLRYNTYSSLITTYIYIVFFDCILTSSFCVICCGGHNKSHRKMTFRRAGGARADDNFTKKPQKKLIRYIVFF